MGADIRSPLRVCNSRPYCSGSRGGAKGLGVLGLPGLFDKGRKPSEDGGEPVATDRPFVAALQVSHDFKAAEHQLPARSGEKQEADARIFRIALDADIA